MRRQRGKLVVDVFGSRAEFEPKRSVERTKEGLARTGKRGRIGGNFAALSPKAEELVVRIHAVAARSATKVGCAAKKAHAIIYRSR